MFYNFILEKKSFCGETKRKLGFGRKDLKSRHNISIEDCWSIFLSCNRKRLHFHRIPFFDFVQVYILIFFSL